MKIQKRFLPILLHLLLSACVYVPVVDENESAKCNTVTKSLSLGKIDSEGDLSMRCRNEGCAAVLAGVATISAGSAIISGSIVLTGNTLHWLEYQGTCSDGYLSKVKQAFLDSIRRKP